MSLSQLYFHHRKYIGTTFSSLTCFGLLALKNTYSAYLNITFTHEHFLTLRIKYDGLRKEPSINTLANLQFPFMEQRLDFPTAEHILNIYQQIREIRCWLFGNLFLQKVLLPHKTVLDHFPWLAHFPRYSTLCSKIGSAIAFFTFTSLWAWMLSKLKVPQILRLMFVQLWV